MGIRFFATPDEFRAWLAVNHDSSDELWVGFHKKGSGRPGQDVAGGGGRGALLRVDRRRPVLGRPASALDDHARAVYSLCMGTKTISLREEAYERLRRARREPGESFSDVVMRAQWPDIGLTAGELLTLYRERGPYLSDEALRRIEEADALDRPPEDKWATG